MKRIVRELTIFILVFMPCIVMGQIVEFKQGDLFGLKDKNGTVITPAKYSYSIQMEIERGDEYIVVQTKDYFGSKYNLIDQYGKEIFRSWYDHIELFDGSKYNPKGLVKVSLGKDSYEKNGLYTYKGECIVEEKAKYSFGFYNEWDNHGIIDVTEFTDPDNGLKQKSGYVDLFGVWLVAPTKNNQYDKLCKNSNYNNPAYIELLLAKKNALSYLEEDFLSYAVVKYVIDEITKWQSKGEIETTAQYKERVTDSAINTMCERLLKEAQVRYVALAMPHIAPDFSLQPYDADKECFTLSSSQYGDYLFNVPPSEAQQFKQGSLVRSLCEMSYVDHNMVFTRLGIQTKENKNYYSQPIPLGQTNFDLDFFVRKQETPQKQFTVIGVDCNGTITEVVKLFEEKGYNIVTDTESQIWMESKKWGPLFIKIDRKKNMVRGVDVTIFDKVSPNFTSFTDWISLKQRIIEISQSYADELNADPSYLFSFEEPYKEGDGRELSAIMDKKTLISGLVISPDDSSDMIIVIEPFAVEKNIVIMIRHSRMSYILEQH